MVTQFFLFPEDFLPLGGRLHIGGGFFCVSVWRCVFGGVFFLGVFVVWGLPPLGQPHSLTPPFLPIGAPVPHHPSVNDGPRLATFSQDTNFFFLFFFFFFSTPTFFLRTPLFLFNYCGFSKLRLSAFLLTPPFAYILLYRRPPLLPVPFGCGSPPFPPFLFPVLLAMPM